MSEQQPGLRSGRRRPGAREPQSERGPAPRTDQDEAAELFGAVSRQTRGRAVTGDRSWGVGDGALLRKLAPVLGNRRLASLTQAEPALAGPPQLASEMARQDELGDGQESSADTDVTELATLERTDTETVRREARPRSLTVALSYSESAMQNYQVTGAKMEDVDAELPANVGEFQHTVVQGLSTQETSEGEVRITQVRLPVQYNYVMPKWTRLAEQPPRVQEAWNRFYGDVMVHEREHLSVSRRHYGELKDALQALPPEERSEGHVREVIDTSIENQNEAHRSHAGFADASIDRLQRLYPRARARSRGRRGRARGWPRGRARVEDTGPARRALAGRLGADAPVREAWHIDAARRRPAAASWRPGGDRALARLHHHQPAQCLHRHPQGRGGGSVAHRGQRVRAVGRARGARPSGGACSRYTAPVRRRHVRATYR